MKKILLFLFAISICSTQLMLEAQNVPDGYVRYEREYIHPDQSVSLSGVPGQKIFDNLVIGTTWYDAQTINYGNIMPRMWEYEDGTVGASWVSAGEDLVPNRGIGYNYYNGTEWGTPDLHVGPEDRHGTVCYAPWGANGEVACTYQYIANEGPIHFFRRDVKGTGDWIQTSVNGPEGTSIVWQSMTTSGENNEFIHLLASTYDTPVQGQDAALLYFRSADGGETWDPDGIIIDGLGSDDLVTINALSFNWSNSVGSNIAFTYGFDEWGGWVFKSDDNGDSWDQITVMESPFSPFFPPDDTPIFGLGIGESSVALDSQGKAHVVFPRMMQGWTGATWGYYPLNSDGLIYWNEDMEPLDTTIISSMGLDNLEAGGYLCGAVFGYDPSVGTEIPDGQPNYAGALCGYPVISIDGNDNIFISSSQPTPGYVSGEGFLYRHIIANASFDGGMTWNGQVDLNDDFQFIFSECAYPAMAPVIGGNTIYFLFQEDIYPGTSEWPSEQPEAVENQMFMMSVPKSVFVGIEENEASLNFELSDLYPNPASSMVQFNINLEEHASVQLNLLNVVGQTVKTMNYGQLNTGNHKLRVEVSELPVGLYYCTVSVDGQSATRKLVIQ